MSASRNAARAIDALKRGWPVAIEAADGVLHVLAVETAHGPSLEAFDEGEAPADLLLSAARAATLRLANQREAASPNCPALIGRVPWLDLPTAIALADPARDLETPLKGPFLAQHVDAPEAAATALRLARAAGLLPALFVRNDGPVEARVIPADLDAYDDPASLVVAARARLPVAEDAKAEIVAFRHAADAAEHVALIIGAPDGTPPLVRLHSECLTGDVLGSLKCDCGPQLHGALHAMTHASWGILLYLRQEGRGIGLINKLRAYQLQDQGFDTVDANLRLGFGVDQRDFRTAARMLTLLGQTRVRLLTNNPNKVAGLEAEGVTVVERVAHKMGENPHNIAYLETKRDRTGHLL
ncbi:GTP cyclohydrolase II [Sphingomonas crocodyli]|uniref:GTP cyclohydrolase-2 n=1 Tax=Sphingomonas crocodyli TaxID=1979270 RepID=A0A437M455_9SPHN|nr:GTP cyclohydrolase II [Sphingomonas crocodyli]RVT92386.1 GTP cyclohydrolase II [Sphingomonas crocodyli]